MSFKSVQAGIAAKEGIPMENAGAILASASRNASPAAKRKNPKLLKVKGAPDPAAKKRPTVRRSRKPTPTIRRAKPAVDADGDYDAGS